MWTLDEARAYRLSLLQGDVITGYINKVLCNVIATSRLQPDINMVQERTESSIKRKYPQRLENSSVPSYE